MSDIGRAMEEGTVLRNKLARAIEGLEGSPAGLTIAISQLYLLALQSFEQAGISEAGRLKCIGIMDAAQAVAKRGSTDTLQ